MQESAAVIQPEIPPSSPAPFWHTFLVVAYLVIPFSWWPGTSGLFAALRGAGRISVYFIELEFQWLFLSFVCIGLFIRKTSIVELVGKYWANIREFFRDAGIGVLFTVSNIMLVIAMVLAFGPGSYSSSPDHLPKSFAELLAFAPIAISAGVGEEFICRGYLQKQFHALTGSVETAMLLQAALFALAHGYDQTLNGFAAKFITGIMFGLLANWRKSLLPGMLAHSFIDLIAGTASSVL